MKTTSPKLDPLQHQGCRDRIHTGELNEKLKLHKFYLTWLLLFWSRVSGIFENHIISGFHQRSNIWVLLRGPQTTNTVQATLQRSGCTNTLDHNIIDLYEFLHVQNQHPVFKYSISRTKLPCPPCFFFSSIETQVDGPATEMRLSKVRNDRLSCYSTIET